MTIKTMTAGLIGLALIATGCSSAKPAATASTPPSSSAPATSTGASETPSVSASASASPTVSDTPSPSDTPTAPAATGDLASMKGPQVMALVATALRNAGSARAKGTLSAGFAGAKGAITIAFSPTASQITMPFKGSTIDLITAPSGVYIKAPLALWTSQSVPAAFAKVLAGHWVIAPAGTSGADTSMTIAGMAKDFEHPTDGKILDAVTTATFAGQPVVVVKQTNGSFVYVATDGSNLPLYVENTGKDGGKLTFSDFGKPNSVPIPKNPIDLTKLGGR